MPIDRSAGLIVTDFYYVLKASIKLSDRLYSGTNLHANILTDQNNRNPLLYMKDNPDLPQYDEYIELIISMSDGATRYLLHELFQAINLTGFRGSMERSNLNEPSPLGLFCKEFAQYYGTLKICVFVGSIL